MDEHEVDAVEAETLQASRQAGLPAFAARSQAAFTTTPMAMCRTAYAE